jgi:hypothetical protein
LVDQEGTPGAEVCYQTFYKICCVENGPTPPPPPPLAPDQEIILHHTVEDGGVCPYDLESSDALHGAQNNQFLSIDGSMPRHFHEEYFRFFQEMMAKPEYQACAVADAAAVLLDAESGVIRAAYDEDRAFWSRPIDADGADGELAFIGAWARLRIAAVNAAVDRVVAGFKSNSSQPASCGTATPDAIGALCASAGIEGVCDQGSLHPRCVPPAQAGYDQCGCPPGYGWSSGQCRVGKSSAAVEAATCFTGTPGASTSGPGPEAEPEPEPEPGPEPDREARSRSRSGPAGAFKHDGDGVTSTIIVVLLVLAVVGVAVAEATGKLRPKKVGEAGVGIYEGSAGAAGVGEVVENPTAPQSL